jgi:hypothetical protein
MQLPLRIVGALTTLWTLYTLYPVATLSSSGRPDRGSINSGRTLVADLEDVGGTGVGAVSLPASGQLPLPGS